ncbi:MAG: hypothetical protein LBF00_03095 [Mycoplasmataceae bacterium]|jgi:hypothetical protein|nr:hypothetical protein [Mycoplasmataceae bacterium]
MKKSKSITSFVDWSREKGWLKWFLLFSVTCVHLIIILCTVLFLFSKNLTLTILLCGCFTITYFIVGAWLDRSIYFKKNEEIKWRIECYQMPVLHYSKHKGSIYEYAAQADGGNIEIKYLTKNHKPAQSIDDQYVRFTPK